MQITIVEHGPPGMRLAKALSRHHRVHLVRSQESAPNEPLAELDGVEVHQGYLEAPECTAGLWVTDANNIAFAYADHIIFTPPVEYGGQHQRYNALVCETTLLDALSYNATASIALQTLVPPGFTDRLSNKLGLSRLIHAFLDLPSMRSNTDRGRLVLGGPAQAATDHAALLRQALGDRFRNILVERTESETVTLLAAQLDLSSPSSIRSVIEHAQQHDLNARVLIECLGLLRPLKGTAGAHPGTTQPAPLDDRIRQAI